MKQERAEYISAIKSLGGDAKGRENALEFIEKSDVWVHGSPAPFPFVPYLYNADDRAFLKDVATTAHGILCKIIARYLEDPSYRSMFGLPAEVERLVMLPCGYDQLLPLARIDLFLDEDDRSFKFCEFNTDGSGAMSRDAMIAQALMGTESFKRFAAEHEDVRPFELFDSWVEAFMRIYRSDVFATVDTPTIAVTDFEESGVFSDFNRFIAAFERAGYPARFTDVRSFEFDGERLIDPADGQQIHAVYRRAVTSEMLQHPGECDALIDAVAAKKVCLVGHFRTTVVHSKMVSIALFDERTRSFLTPEECAFVDAHCPRTYVLSSEPAGFTLDEVKRDKDAWIVKPADDYGAHGVYPGVDFDQAEWERIVEDNLDAGYIVQEFYPPHHVDIMRTALAEGDDPMAVESWQSMPGIYIYDGKPQGLYCRLGQEGVIAIDHGGLCANSFAVD